MEKEIELMAKNKLKCLDRHELEKILDSQKIPFYNYESDDSLREKVWEFCNDWDECLVLG